MNAYAWMVPLAVFGLAFVLIRLRFFPPPRFFVRFCVAWIEGAAAVWVAQHWGAYWAVPWALLAIDALLVGQDRGPR